MPIRGNIHPHPAPFLKDQGPSFEVQVTVSKRLTFWNGSLMYFGVGKVVDKLLIVITRTC